MRMRRLLAIVGPGLLVAATGVGAGNLAMGAFPGNTCIATLAFFAMAVVFEVANASADDASRSRMVGFNAPARQVVAANEPRTAQEKEGAFPMAMLRVCGVQMQVQQAKKDNLPKILEHIKNYQGDFILFPEMALTGCNNDFSDSRTAEAWNQIAAACRLSYLTAIVGTGARMDGKSYIQARVFGDDGEVVGTYEKILPTQQERAWCRPGDELRAWDYKGIRFGCLIGNDFWVTPGAGPFPDPRLTHQLGQKGARVVFHLVNSGSDQLYLPYHEANLRLRAMESGCYIVTANAAPADGPVNCPSGVMSPEGEWLVQCPRDGEHRFCFDIELDLDLD